MPRVCTVCSHPDRGAIDQALVSGQSYRSIAKRSGTSPSAVLRHKESHLSTTLIKASGAREVARADDLLRKVSELEAEARRIGRKAEREGDLRCAIASVKQLMDIVDLLARLLDAFPRDGKGLNEGPSGISITIQQVQQADGTMEAQRAIIRIGEPEEDQGEPDPKPPPRFDESGRDGFKK